jgi:phenylacetate-CoA ligase
MSVYTSLCSSVLFPLHERLKHHDSVAVRKRLEEQERWPREKLEQWRVNTLRQFLLDVNARVPYYRDLFKRLDFHPHALKSIADLQALPLNDKASMRAAGEGLKAEGAQNLSRYNTGGSSGEPLIFYIGKGRKSHDVGAKWRVTRWWGVDIGDPEIVVWGSPIELGAQDRVRMVRDAVLRTELLPAFEMSEANLDRFVETIRVKRPTMLFGYPSSLSLIAAHARKKGIRLDAQGIKVVFVTALRRAARHHHPGVWRPGGQRLWRPGRGFHRPPVPGGRDAPPGRRHHRRNRRPRWAGTAPGPGRRNRGDPHRHR